MKHIHSLIFLIIFSLLISACVELKEIEGTTTFYTYDFTQYSKKGFLITPEKPISEYESVGLITISVIPTLKTTVKNFGKADSVKSKNQLDGNYTRIEGLDGSYTRIEGLGTVDFLLEKLDPAEVIRLAYVKAVKMGADAIINFKIENELCEGLGIKYYGIKVSGFAIKRKN